MTIHQVMHEHRLTLPDNGHCHLNTIPWHGLAIQRVGEVHGLHNLRGKLVATNGILGVLIMPNDKFALIHIENFVPDKTESVGKVRRNSLQAMLAKYQ